MSLKKNNLLFILLFMGVSSFFVSCEESEVDMGDWTEASDFEGKPRTEAICFMINDIAYIGTGIDEDGDRMKDLWSFDVSTGTWEQLASMPDDAIERSAAVAFNAGGKGYVGTGIDDDGNELKDFWVYDPDNNEWSALDVEFPGDVRYSAVAFTINDHGYVGTGYNDDNGEMKDFYKYDSSDDSWTKVAYPGSKRRDACAFVIDDTAYFVTGKNNDTNEDEFYSYNEDAGWVELRKISDDDDDEDYDDDYTTIVRSSAVAFTINGKGYLATGSSTSSIDDVWEYDPTTDLWDQKTDFEASSRTQAVGFAVGNYGYVTTGQASATYYYTDMTRFDPNAEYDDNY